MFRVTSNSIIVPPLDCAWLSLNDYRLSGSCCLQFECKGENDVTIILKPFPGAKRWQHLQRQQGPAGGEQFAVEANYTVILGSHRNSKLKIEKDGDEKAVATGLPGCTVTPAAFTACWINYSAGCIAVGTGPVGSSLSYIWQDPEAAIADIQHIGLSSWDKHVSYRNVQLLPPLPPHQLAELQADLQRRLAAEHLQRQLQAHADGQADVDHDHHHHQQQQQQEAATVCQEGSGMPARRATSGQPGELEKRQQQQQQDPHPAQHVPPLLQRVQHAIVAHLQPQDVCHMLQLSEALLPRTQCLYDQAVQLAGEWFALLTQQHLQELAMLPLDVFMDVVHEPLLDVPELAVFEAVAAWCQAGGLLADSAASTAQQAQAQQPPGQLEQLEQDGQLAQQQQQQQHAVGCRSHDEVLEVLQLVRFALMSDAERQAVLDHPFSRACPVVQQCMQDDLQRLQDYHEGRPLPAGEGGFRCQQRRLVLPACQGLSTGTLPDGQQPPAAASPEPGGQQPGGDGGSGEINVCRAMPGSHSAETELQQPGRTGSGSGSGSGSGTAARSGGSWRSYRRRLAPSCRELMYVCDGDRNGVIHYIATEYGSKPWVNPVLSKALEIKASSPCSRYTDPKALVSGQFLNTSFAGPRYVRQPPAAAPTGPAAAPAASTPSTWWQLDLGPQHRLLCNYYAIRHDGSQEGYARSWSLQGSNDLQHWLDLRRHTDDTTIRLPGQYGSWPVTGPAACMPFRAFRLLLTGPTQSPTNPWAFCLSYCELYGYFYKSKGSAAATSAQQAATQ